MLAHKQFEALLEESSVFWGLSTDLKKEILGATGEERDRYEQIFTTERDGMVKARQQFNERNTAAVSELKYEVKNIVREQAADKEMAASKSAEAKGVTLLKKLDKL